MGGKVVSKKNEQDRKISERRKEKWSNEQTNKKNGHLHISKRKKHQAAHPQTR